MTEPSNPQEFKEKDEERKTAPEDSQAGGEEEIKSAEQTRIEELEAQLTEWENKYRYLYAEFENFKKRVEKERTEHLKYGWEPLAHDLLQVIDNMERALEHAGEADKGVVEGLHMVLELFKKSLEKRGVQKIDAAGRPFDPNVHEAVAKQHSEHHDEGHVIHEHQPGYTMHGRLLRPARVVVSGGKASEKTEKKEGSA